MEYTLNDLYQPEVYAVGRLPARSDHFCQGTERLTLDGTWCFRWSETPEERPDGFFAENYDTSGWDEIKVPGHIQLQGYGQIQYTNIAYPWDGHEDIRPPMVPKHNPVGSYRRTFTASPQGRRSRLRFEGVETAFYVWLNGTYLGYSEDSFTPSEFDVTGILREGENTLAVEVFRFSTASWLEDQDFFRFSGIFRSVYLDLLPPLFLEDLGVKADASGAFSAELRLSGAVEGAAVAAELLDPKGKPVWAGTALAKEIVTFAVQIETPQLWNPEEPRLYTLRLLGFEKDAKVPSFTAEQPVGFRTFQIEDGIMKMNGKRVVFCGVNRHDFDASCGRAVTDEHRRRDIFTMKRNNINALRTCHYPNGSGLYALTDRYGLYVMDETNLETHGTWMRAGRDGQAQYIVPKDDPRWVPALLDRANSMYMRDRNHPSVVIWSCGNESFGGEDIWKMSQFFREKDPTRPVHYEGIFLDRSYPDTSDIESRMYCPPEQIVEYLENNPPKPYIDVEYMHAMGNSCGGMMKYTELADKYPKYQGGFIWDFIDQALWQTLPDGRKRLGYGGDFGDRPNDGNFSGDGLVFGDGSPSPKLQEVKALYSPFRLVASEQGVIIENRNLFAGTENLALRWTAALDGRIYANGELKMPVIPAGDRKLIPFTVPQSPKNGELCVTYSLVLAAEEPWAERGHEIASGQWVSGSPIFVSGTGNTPSLIPGAANYGLKTPNYEALFSVSGLYSLHTEAGELMEVPPRPWFWRAPTDNDIANGHPLRCSFWKAASEYSSCMPQPDPSLPGAKYLYQLGGGKTAELSFTGEADGICCKLTWQGDDTLPELPLFGVRFAVPSALCNVKYYGLGPEENHIDRREGARLGLYTYEVSKNLTPYLRPQESGNRTCVRYAELTDAQGAGLRIECTGAPFELSVLPWSCGQLEEAAHPDELPPAEHTWVVISAAQMGVGGINTWGARTIPEYTLPAAEPRTLEFVIRPCTAE